MWMQALVAAGIPHLGEAFPADWGDSPLREANPDGFFEGPYVNGVFFGTNPSPDGRYLQPQALSGTVAKVFVPGVLRTERVYIEGVVANVREWREYEASVTRLHQLNAERLRKDDPSAYVPELLPPAIQWWVENFSLVRDAATRGYPLQLQTYRQVLEEPRGPLEAALAVIGAGDIDAALAAVDPARRTKKELESQSVEPRIARMFDEFHERVAAGEPFEPPFIRACADLTRELEPLLHRSRFERMMRSLQAGAPPPAALMMAAAME